MTDPTPIAAAHTVKRMRAIAAELTAAGLHTRLYQSPRSVDVTATRPRGPRRGMEVVVDEDNYVELRYWHRADATAAQIAAVITQAMDAITAAQEKWSGGKPPAGGEPGGNTARAARPR